MTTATAATLGARLHEARRRLAEAGVGSPSPDAERLAARALRITWGGLWSRLRDPMGPRELAAFDDLVKRRSGGEPLAYIEGSTVFGGLTVRCAPGALVPRPETETLVDVALRFCPPPGRQTVVDVGTGTGAVALAVAAARPCATVWATDRSADAVAVARENVERLGLRVHLASGDLLSALDPGLRGALDVIVSNPPYVAAADHAALPADVRREPVEALVAGPRGDEVLERLGADAPVWLAPSGALVCEVGTPEQARDHVRRCRSWAAAAGVVDDHTGRPRVVWARR